MFVLHIVGPIQAVSHIQQTMEAFSSLSGDGHRVFKYACVERVSVCINPLSRLQKRVCAILEYDQVFSELENNTH